jgi:hypothetical protein
MQVISPSTVDRQTAKDPYPFKKSGRRRSGRGRTGVMRCDQDPECGGVTTEAQR